MDDGQTYVTTDPVQVGPYLLGRKYVPDARDWTINSIHQLTAPTDALLDMTVREAIETQNWFRSWSGILALWRWIKSVLARPKPIPSPDGDVLWGLDAQLDQGNTGHCVGFGWACWGNTLPVDDQFQNPDGHRVYYETKIIEGEPGNEDGATVRGGAKAMQARKRLAAYAFASSVDEIIEWLTNHGPVVMGTDWTDDMFQKDRNGFVRPTGGLAGGHCYTAIGYHPHRALANGTRVRSIEFDNSWGLWGRFEMTVEDVALLLARDGEACVALELAI